MKFTMMLVLAVTCAACNGAAPAAAPGNTLTSGNAAAPPDAGAPPAQQASPAPATADAVQKTNAAADREVTIPSGTQLHLKLVSAVSSDESRVEDTVRAELRQPVVVKGETVVPAGAELTGTVTDVERSGRVKGLARVAYRFTSLSYGGRRYDIRTSSVAHQAQQTKGDDAKKIAIGAGAGAAVGALLGGGSGAAKGAAIGGAGGTGAVLATRGKEVRVGPGAVETVRLASPVSVRVRS